MASVVEKEKETLEIDLEFLDHKFKLEIMKDLDLEELFEIIEKFITEMDISLDLKTLSKTYLDTEYYNLILKQQDIVIRAFNEIKIGIPLRLELESDHEKKRYFTKKRLKSTLRHLNSIAINEFITMFQITNTQLFRQSLHSLESEYPIKIEDDILYLSEPLDKTQLKTIANKLLDFMDN